MNCPMLRLSGLLMLVLVYSCSPDERRESFTDHEQILHSKQFAGITDSISRSPDNVELLLQRAIRLSQHNHHTTATSDYKRAYELTNDPGIALEYSANLLLASDEREALYILEQGKEKFPDNPEFSRRLAEIYTQNRLYRKALAEYNNIIAADSSNFEALFERGNMLANMGDTAGAIESLERSFSIMPINLSGLALANIYVARHNPRALAICDILLARDSAQVQTDPVYMKGVFYAETKQYDRAIQQFDECIRRDWKLTDAHIEKGIIYYERKDYNKALEVFNLAATVSNTDADVYFWLGRCYEAMGNEAQATANYERAIALDNNFMEAREALRRVKS